jgi:hypothetical protein
MPTGGHMNLFDTPPEPQPNFSVSPRGLALWA